MAGHASESLELLARALDRDWYKAARDPDWEGCPGSTDWRYFIDQGLRREWGSLDYKSQLVAYVVAAGVAQRVRDRKQSAT